MVYDETRCKWNTKDITDLKNDIYGNGKDGIKVRLVKLETKLGFLISTSVAIVLMLLSLTLKTFIF